jgi:Uma2 family endonuclease
VNVASRTILGHLFLTYQETHPQGSALDATLPEQTIPTTPNRRRCDRAVWVGLGRIPDEEKDIPVIVIEFVSGSRRDHLRDYEVKLREYITAGVIEYWIIDRFRRIMTVYWNTLSAAAF